MRLESFFLGVITTTSLIAAVYFLKFWRHTRDSLFLCFSVAFFIEGLHRAALMFVARPNEGASWVYLVRLLAFLIILGGILYKNYGPSPLASQGIPRFRAAGWEEPRPR